MPTTAISVPEVHCQHCVDSIESALAAGPGVRTATVDLQRREVTVDWDEDGTSVATLVQVIEDQGYEVAGSPAPQGGAEPDVAPRS